MIEYQVALWRPSKLNRQGEIMTVEGTLRSLVTVGIWIVVWVAALPAQTQHTLDFRTPRSLEGIDSIPERERLEHVIQVVTDSPGEALPVLRVALLSLSAASFRLGESFTYEVAIENIGAATISFPASQDPRRFRRAMAGAKTAMMILAFDDPILGLFHVAPVVAYGAEPIAGSLITLQPGDTVRIFGGGQWITAGPRIPAGWSVSDIDVRAQLHLQEWVAGSFLVDWPPAVSANAVTVELRRRP